MASTQASSDAVAATPSPLLVLFARGLIAILTTWPVLRIAISENWGGPDSLKKRTWMASELVDLFEASLPKPSPFPSGPTSIPDADDVEDLLLQAMVDEFGCEVDDGSSPKIAREVVDLWMAVIGGEGAAAKVLGLEARANKTSGTAVHARRAESDDDGDDDDDDDDEMDVDGGGSDEEVPTLQHPATAQPASQPEVDQDGFMVVKGKSRR
ncbi:hypothetical protein FRB93_002947 [Tulasnella sp. JGI-2019a]|nr:hypothetical protein FRB93_002947 [Tulasnella sp. JGI-2019a]